MQKPLKQKRTKQVPIVQIEEDALRSKIKIGWKEATVAAVVIVLVVIIAAYFIAGGKGKGGEVKLAAAGSIAPEFRLPSLDGREIGLSDLRGKVVIVHFWATWCPPCVEEIPTLERLYRAYIDKNFEILAVSVDEGGPGVVTSFAQRHGISFPVVLDPRRSVSTLYGTFKFPESYIIDAQGTVREKIIGPRDWTDPVSSKTIQELLGS